MDKVMAVLVWPIRKVKGLRALVQDEDHDTWLETHREQEHRKSPDVRAIVRGGPGGGGGT
jgi:hypothetical protein